MLVEVLVAWIVVVVVEVAVDVLVIWVVNVLVEVGPPLVIVAMEVAVTVEVT